MDMYVRPLLMYSWQLFSGPVVWYQAFEYAIGHWFQKATEHVFGCVLCSPGEVIMIYPKCHPLLLFHKKPHWCVSKALGDRI